MEIKDKIIEKFLYNHELKYSDIWDKEVPSNKFNYYLQKLVEEGLIHRIEEKYSLTDEGKRYVSLLDGTEVKQKPKPLPCVFIVAQNDKGEILFHRRKRQPFLDMYGIPGGKIEYGGLLEEEAQKEFSEETGLNGNLELKLITNYLTYNSSDNKLNHHMIGFFYLATNLRGELVKENAECENFFCSIDSVDQSKVFPDLPVIIPKIINNKELEVMQAKRYINGNTFEKVEFL